MTLSLMPLHHLITGPPPDAAWNFTLDEIRQQLAYLNVTNLSDSHICQLKKQLDDLIAKELEHVQVASELSCCRIEDPVSSHLDSVSKFSSDSGDCTTPESEMHKSLSDLDSHHTVPTFAPQSNYSNRKGQSTKLFSKPHAWVRPCRSARTGYLSHVLQSDMRTESRDTVSSISEISDSSAVGLPAEQGADDASSAHPRSLFRDRYLECPSLFPGTVDSQYKRHRDTHRRPHTDCTRITASSTLVPQITRVMQWDCSPTATPATVAPKINSRPLSTCDLLRPSNQRQTKERGSSKPPLRTLHLPLTRTTNVRHGVVFNPDQMLPARRPDPNSLHPQSHRLDMLRGSQRSPVPERTATRSDGTLTKSHTNIGRHRHSVSQAAEPVDSATRRVVQSSRFTDQPFEKIHDVPLRSTDTVTPFCLKEYREVTRPTSATTIQNRSRTARLSRRKDPVSRFQQYQRIWLTHLVPGEDARRVLRWNIKTAMMHREVPLLQRNLTEISQLFGRDAVIFLERERARHLKSLQPNQPTTGRHHP